MPHADAIAGRIARYIATEDARALWPDVTPAAFRAGQEEVARVASAALGAAGGPVVLRIPPAADLRTLGIGAMTAGMGPLLGWWIETGRVRADADARALFAAHLEQGRLRARRLRRELEGLAAAFTGRGVPFVALKGGETAWRYFPDPGTRPLADLDLLVAPGDVRPAEEALRALGFTQDAVLVPERGHWLPAERGKVRSLEMPDADNPWHVDLHVSLDRRHAAGIVASLGAVSPAAWEPWPGLAGSAHVLSQPIHLAYLAVHASSDFTILPMVRLVELVLVARREFHGRPERWAALLELLRETRSARFVHPALDLAERLVPGTVDPRVLDVVRAAASPRLRRAVAAVTPGSSQRLYVRPAAGRLVWAETLREAAVIVLGAIWPKAGGRRVPLRVLGAIYRVRVLRTLRALTGGR